MVKRLIKKLLPKGALLEYHKVMAKMAAFWYRNPSSSMVVIGVTGTNGKTTTSNMIAKLLEGAGRKVGLATTCNFRVAGEERINATKMTMLGRFALQKLLREMADAGCEFAVIETSSEGMLQYRHHGISYDVAVLTNLTPEHIESHGSFENYKATKMRLFEKISVDETKRLFGSLVPKVSVVNLSSEHAKDFLAPTANKKFGYYAPEEGRLAGGIEWPIAIVKALDIKHDEQGSTFTVREQEFSLPMLGPANVENALAAISCGIAFGIDLPTLSRSMAEMTVVPGRQERIEAGQPYVAMVDYAHEPEALKRLYQMLESVPRNKTIQVVGSAGGGRDKARRPLMGQIAAKNADIVIVTNEDPYDEDPKRIIEEVAEGARSVGKVDGQNLFVISERREALAKAAQLAEEGDLLLTTGKGAEQWICIEDGKKLQWDERDELADAIRRSQKQ